MNYKVGLASDHAGYKLKNKVIDYLKNKKIEVIDYGTYSEESCDYPDFAHKLAFGIENNDVNIGISFCGSGNGINIAANKHKKIRSALCWNKEISKLARQHNDANICAIPARFISYDEAIEIIEIFLNTQFERGRHSLRIEKI